MSDKYVTRYLTWLVVREIQIKTIMKYFIPIRLATSEVSNNTNCWGGCGTTSSVITLLVGV